MNYPAIQNPECPVLRKYLGDLELAGKADRTRYAHLHTVRRAGRLAGKPAYELSTDDIRSILQRKSRNTGKPLGRSTVFAEMTILRGWFRWLVAEGVRPDDPIVAMPLPKQPRRLPRPVAVEDMEMAIALADPTVASWLTLAAFAGLRACEIAPLRLSDINFSTRVILIQRGKGGRPGAVPAHQRVLDAVRALKLSTNEWIYPHFDHVRHVPPWKVSQDTNKYLRSVGIEATLHQFRHRFGTSVYQTSGRDLRTTQELMRHQSPVSTAIYTWVDPVDGRAAVDAL